MDADDPPFRPVPLPAGTSPVPRPSPPSADRVGSPDLAGQLRAVAAGTRVSAVVCCLLDTDPAVPLNAAVSTAAPADLVAGLAALSVAAAGARVMLVVDPEATGVWSALRPHVRRPARLVPLRNDYPQADPSLLLFTLFHRRLPPGRLPTDRGVLLVDAAAAVDVGRPGTGSVAVAVRDHFAGRTHLLDVPEGLPLADVLRSVDVDPASAVVRAGEFLRDRFVPANTPVTAAGERVFHVTAAALAANPDPCVRCGWCVEACPTRIHPAGLLDAAQRSDPTLAARYGLAGCIECGICSYVCPTRLPLLAAIRGLKRGGEGVGA